MSLPSGLNAYCPESKPGVYVASTVAVPPARSAFTISLALVSYATVVPPTNCGDEAAPSKEQRLRAFAGSWMSRTTTVGSPTTVPMTRLSPAGTVVAQCTSEAIEVELAVDDGEAVAVDAGEVLGVVRADGDGGVQAAMASVRTKGAARQRTE